MIMLYSDTSLVFVILNKDVHVRIVIFLRTQTFLTYSKNQLMGMVRIYKDLVSERPLSEA